VDGRGFVNERAEPVETSRQLPGPELTRPADEAIGTESSLSLGGLT